MVYFTTLLLTMLTTIGIVPLLVNLANRLQLMDFPDARKVHASPIPRIGGIAMVVGILPTLGLHSHLDRFALVILAGAAAIVVFAVIDDSIGMGYKAKFGGQIIAGTIVIFGANLIISSLGRLPDSLLEHFWVAFPLTLLVVVAVTNAINLMDGLDGLAGGMMAQILLCLCLIASRCGNEFIALITIAAVGAIFGFLRFNTFPASIFMGDAGSQLLGFLGIVLAVDLAQSVPAISPLFPLLLFCFPVLDTAVVMFTRIHRGYSPFRPDNTHFHHKLIRLGLKHRAAVLTVYVIQLFFVLLAYIFRFSGEWVIAAVTFVAVMLVPVPIYICHAKGCRIEHLVEKMTKGAGPLPAVEAWKGLLLSGAQGVVEYGVPLIFFITTMLPASIWPVTSAIGGGILLAMLVKGIRHTQWGILLIRFASYIVLPLLFLHCQQAMAPWGGSTAFSMYAGLYGILACGAMLLLKFTRRKRGFQLTPTDFLIVSVALIVPNLPDPVIETLQLGVWITYLVVFCFSVEVLLGELRGTLSRLEFMLVPSFAVLVVRGIYQMLG